MKTGQKKRSQVSSNPPSTKWNVSDFTGVLKQQSRAHTVEIEVPQLVLEQKFSEYWYQVKDILPPNIVKAATKGGFREVSRKRAVAAAGGKGQFFAPVLAEVVNMYLDAQPRQALLISGVELVELENLNYVVRALIYLEPEVTWKKVPGVDSPIIVKVPRQPDGWMDVMVDEYLKRGQQDSLVLVPVQDDSTSATDGHVILLDCQSLIDGVPWSDGCVKNNKWPVDKKYYRQPEIYDAILGMKKGDEKQISFILGEHGGENQGKTVQATIRINQVFGQEVPDIDDDLALNYGFKTLDAWKAALRSELQDKLESQRANLIDVSTMSALVNQEVVDVDPIPFSWMAEKAKEIYGTIRSKVNSEEDLVRKFAGSRTLTGEEVKDKNTVLTYLGEKSAQSLIHDLVLRSWGRKVGVEGNSTLSNIKEYVERVQQKLKSLIQIEEFDINQHNQEQKEQSDAPVSV